MVAGGSLGSGKVLRQIFRLGLDGRHAEPSKLAEERDPRHAMRVGPCNRARAGMRIKRPSLEKSITCCIQADCDPALANALWSGRAGTHRTARLTVE